MGLVQGGLCAFSTGPALTQSHSGNQNGNYDGNCSCNWVSGAVVPSLNGMTVICSWVTQ